mgnify:CR=1 FL=1
MAIPMLKAEKRSSVGKNRVSKKRQEGLLPGVVYSRGMETQSIYLDSREVYRFLAKHGMSGRLTLELDGQQSYVIIKEIQRNVLKNQLLHVDFQTLREDEKVRMTMPIIVLNRERAETGEGILQIQLNEVEIQTYPRHIPDRVEVDASKLLEQDSLTLADLNIIDNKDIEILDDISSVIASIVYVSEEELEAVETVEEDELLADIDEEVDVEDGEEEEDQDTPDE